MALELERVIGPMREAAAADRSPADRLALFAEAYQQVLFSADCLAMYRFVIGSAGQSPEFGAAFNETVVDYVVSLVTPMIESATGASAREARDKADVFIGTLQGSELNRALAGVSADPARLASLRKAAIAAALE
jgi:hypothetical protein